MPGAPRLPRFFRWLVTLVTPRDRRSDVESDLTELYEGRRTMRGSWYALGRLAADIMSLFRPSGFKQIGQDLLFAARLFRRHPAMIVLTTVGLALAIGVSTSVFSIINGAALRPFGVSDPATLFAMPRTYNDATGSIGVSSAWPYGQFVDLARHASRSSVAAFLEDGATFSVTAGARATSESLQLVSGGFFALTGGRANLGRVLTPEDDQPGAPPVVILSHGFWTRRLGSDPGIVGRTVWLGGVPVNVAGVTARNFSGPVDRPPAMWVAFAAQPLLYRSVPLGPSSNDPVRLVVRPGAGVTASVAQAELSSIAASFVAGPQDPQGARFGARLDASGGALSGGGARQARLAITLILAVIALVLMLACANAANVMLARTAARRTEIGVRLALGAGRARVMRQLLTESLALGVAAGALGLLITLWLVPVLVEAIHVPSGYDVYPDFRVFVFLTIVSVACGVLSGWGPARQSTRRDIWTPIHGSGSTRGSRAGAGRLQAVLIGLQAAASMVLLVIAALMTRSMMYVAHVDLGFEPARLIAISASFPRGVYGADRTSAYWMDARDRVRAMPGIESASLAWFPPFGRSNMMTSGSTNGRPSTIYYNRTDDRFFDTAGIRLLRGRVFNADEVAADAPVAVISATTAKEWFGNDDAVGRVLDLPEGPSRRVIGVVAEAVTTRIRRGWSGTVYTPLSRADHIAARLIVRASDAGTALQPTRRALEAFDRNVGVAATRVSDDMESVLGVPRMLATLSSAVGILALALAVAGLYGVTAFSVSERSKEIGIRVAIGATAASVVTLVLRDNLKPVVVGTTIGAVLALAASQIVSETLSGVSGRDPLAFASATVVLLAAATAAVIIPARRAARMDPTTVLRQS